MTKNRDAILLGAYLYNTRRLSQPADIVRRGSAAKVSRRCAALDRFCTRLDCAGWLGRVPTPAERRALSRELVQCEEDGLLLRLNGRGGDRTTHVYLTERGEAEALRILSESVEFQPIETPWNEDDPVPAE